MSQTGYPDYETVERREGCKTCRHFHVYHFSFSPNYDTIDFDNHYPKCDLCQKWVEEWNQKNRTNFGGVDLWRDGNE